MEELSRAAENYFRVYEKCKQEDLQNGESMEEFYIRKAKISVRKCNACRRFLAGLYFCCIACENCDDYYSLCVNCFYDVTLKHDVGEQHESFADNHSILTMVKKGGRNPTCKILKKPKGNGLQQRPQRKPLICDITKVNQEMEKLARTSNAEYNAASQEMKDKAKEFCRKVIRGAKDGHRLTQNEFLTVMKNMNYPKHADRDLFRMLAAKHGNHHVTKEEALTLYYIIQNEIPFCSVCEQLAVATFFYCSKCPAAKYAICLGCHERGDYSIHKRNKHPGDDHVDFVNTTMLFNRLILT